MDRDIDLGKDAARPSGAPEAGGATTLGSIFGGQSLVAKLWRMLARVARDLEATAYRRLRDLEAERLRRKQATCGVDPGAPKRVKQTQAHKPA
jgi:hypothetical protein